MMFFKDREDRNSYLDFLVLRKIQCEEELREWEVFLNTNACKHTKCLREWALRYKKDAENLLDAIYFELDDLFYADSPF